MTVDNKIAKAVGALFIITMLLGMVDAYTVAPLLSSPLEHIYANETRVFVGAFSILFMAIGVVGIAILLYPILERLNKLVAITYVSFRVMECLLLIVGVIVYILLIQLSQRFIGAGSPDGSHFQTLSTIAVEARYGAYHVAMIILSIASLMLCYLLYKSRLIPRFISVVGFIGYVLVLLSAPLDILNIIDTTGAGGIMYIPGAILEIFLLPFWLIIKGFNSSATASG
jgi:uncharacterized protein DUF4386